MSLYRWCALVAPALRAPRPLSVGMRTPTACPLGTYTPLLLLLWPRLYTPAGATMPTMPMQVGDRCGAVDTKRCRVGLVEGTQDGVLGLFPERSVHPNTRSPTAAVHHELHLSAGVEVCEAVGACGSVIAVADRKCKKRPAKFYL